VESTANIDLARCISLGHIRLPPTWRGQGGTGAGSSSRGRPPGAAGSITRRVSAGSRSLDWRQRILDHTVQQGASQRRAARLGWLNSSTFIHPLDRQARPISDLLSMPASGHCLYAAFRRLKKPYPSGRVGLERVRRTFARSGRVRWPGSSPGRLSSLELFVLLGRST